MTLFDPWMGAVIGAIQRRLSSSSPTDDNLLTNYATIIQYMSFAQTILAIVEIMVYFVIIDPLWIVSAILGILVGILGFWTGLTKTRPSSVFFFLILVARYIGFIAFSFTEWAIGGKGWVADLIQVIGLLFGILFLVLTFQYTLTVFEDESKDEDRLIVSEVSGYHAITWEDS